MSAPIGSEPLIGKEKFDTLTLSQVEWQIELRRQMMGKMVGWLYPSVLRDEITALNTLRHKMKFPEAR